LLPLLLLLLLLLWWWWWWLAELCQGLICVLLCIMEGIRGISIICKGSHVVRV
jgi:hypothetical protein